MLKRILFRTNIRRNSSAEYSAETDVAKLVHYSSYEEYSFLAESSVFGRIFGHFTYYLVNFAKHLCDFDADNAKIPHFSPNVS